MATRAGSWATKYLDFAAWTQHELRNLLCGFPPSPSGDIPLPPDTPVPSRTETADKFVAEEMHRVGADRHIQDAILAGDLKVLDPPDEKLLAKISAVLEPDELEALRRALAHHRTCNKAYRVSRDAAVRWAVRRRGLFPAFPFTLDDLQPVTGPASVELRDHRRQLVKRALAGKSQSEFCRATNGEVTVDVLRAVIAGDSRRADLAKRTPQILELLGIATNDWNAT